MSTGRKMWTYYKGDWHEGDVRILGAASHATWLGSLVFDGARLFDGVSPDLDLHSRRINDSARAMMLEPTYTGEEIEALSMDGIKKFAPNTDIYIRPMYWAEESDIGIIPPKASSTDFALCLEEMPMVEPKGSSITTTRFHRPTLSVATVNAKAACLYANNARMIREAQAKGFDNALVTDCAGNVAELASSNVLMVRGGEVFTPVPNGTFLAGITRNRVITLLRDAGVPVHEVTLSVEDFLEADEIFSTGNVSKVMPVTKIEDRELDHGPITQKALSLYMEWAHA